MKVIAYDDGGSVVVVVPSNSYAIEEVIAKDVPKDKTPIVLDVSKLPDRYFRGAWTLNGQDVHVDMPKAIDIHLARLRERREEKLKVLDVEWMKHMGQKKQKEADDVEAIRQKLRDMPTILRPQLDAAQTPEALKAITLDVL